MSEINLPREERDALKAVDADLLDKLIEQSLYDERPDALRTLQLEWCGAYVASRFRAFVRALAEHHNAKAAKKRAETEYRARRAGSDLEYAVQQMKHRVETEEREEQFFWIDDRIMPPHSFSTLVTVRVSYRWRKTLEDEWTYGNITFSHNVNLQPNYAMPLPNRKPSAAKLKQEQQDKLYDEWEHLKSLGLHSVKQYFKEGRDGAAIPQTFQAVADSYTRTLNNFSAQFWPRQASTISTVSPVQGPG